MAAKLILSPDRCNSKQFACEHWGFKADDHHKCMSCRALHGNLCSKSVTCHICESWNEALWEDYHGKLQILLIKKAVSGRPQVLSHISLVLQDRGIIDAFHSEVESPSLSPKRLKVSLYSLPDLPPERTGKILCCTPHLLPATAPCLKLPKSISKAPYTVRIHPSRDPSWWFLSPWCCTL